MKKISLIFLSLVLVFMVGCSAQSSEDTAFLDSVKGKYAGVKEPVKAGFFFNKDGKTAVNESGVGTSITYIFKSAESNTKATYTAEVFGASIEATFEVADSKLSVTISGDVKQEIGELK